jgi:hypothetical protein
LPFCSRCSLLQSKAVDKTRANKNVDITMNALLQKQKCSMSRCFSPGIHKTFVCSCCDPYKVIQGFTFWFLSLCSMTTDGMPLIIPSNTKYTCNYFIKICSIIWNSKLNSNWKKCNNIHYNKEGTFCKIEH